MLDLKMQFNESNLDDEINENDLSFSGSGYIDTDFADINKDLLIKLNMIPIIMFQV